MTQYEAVIGLEVHAQLNTATKIFCGCSTSFGNAPNQNTCPVCLGLPGALPVLNRRVVEYALRFGLAVGSEIHPASRFARKNYFYPDLPKGYQISQYEDPICLGGSVPLMLDGQRGQVRLTRIHMEEDAGKSIHMAERGESWVDLNRAGVPLIEIVSEPEIRSSEEAVAYLKSLRSILRYLEICDGNMEEGSFRCDANVSVRPPGQTELGTKVEVKNMNSFRHVQRALEYEIDRQIDLLRSGGAVAQETRLWDADAGVTRSMRGKEEAHDYRYFPDPDLLPVTVSPAWLERLRAELPELPQPRFERFQSQYGLSEYDADVLTASKELADYYEAVMAEHGDAKRAANWVQVELLGFLNEQGLSVAQSPVTGRHLGQLLTLIENNTISGKMAKSVFVEMTRSGEAPSSIVARVGSQVSDSSLLAPIVGQVLDAFPEQVQTFLDGKEKILGFFVGQVMRRTKGKANPEVVNAVLLEQLAARRTD